MLVARPRREIRVLCRAELFPGSGDIRFFGLGMARRDGGADDIGAHAAVAGCKGFDERRHGWCVHRIGGNDAFDIAERTGKIRIAAAGEQDGVYQPAVEANTHPDARLRGVGIHLLNEVIEAAIEVRHP